MLAIDSLFHAYDIRGVYETELTSEVARMLGQAFGTYCICHGHPDSAKNRIAVGRDNRPSGVPLSKAFIDGVAATGCGVFDLGVAVTPQVNFSEHYLDVLACVSVTASHNAPEYNGLKISFQKQPFSSKDYQELKKIAVLGKMEKGKGKVVKKNVWEPYKEKILTSVGPLARPLSIVIDSGNGTTGEGAPELFRVLGCTVVELFTKSDGTFPNHVPYPQKQEYYDHLKKRIREEQADFGLAFDGDGDRVGIYDEMGRFVPEDILGGMFAASLLEKNPGSSVVFTIGTSLAVREYIEKHGGTVTVSATGYPRVVQKMKVSESIFGAELSGHFFFADKYLGYSDGLYSGARFCEMLSRNTVSVSQLVAAFPRYFATAEIRVPIPASISATAIMEQMTAAVKTTYPQAQLTTIDGIYLSFPSLAWFLIRPSNTEPVLSVRVEAKTKQELAEKQEMVSKLLSSVAIEISWQTDV